MAHSACLVHKHTGSARARTFAILYLDVCVHVLRWTLIGGVEEL